MAQAGFAGDRLRDACLDICDALAASSAPLAVGILRAFAVAGPDSAVRVHAGTLADAAGRTAPAWAAELGQAIPGKCWVATDPFRESGLEAGPLGKLGLMQSRKQHPAELRERAVAMVFELRAESGSSRGTLASVGQKLGVNPETLRNWVEKAEIDSGQRPGTTSDDKKRIAELEKEVRELRRANEILKAASAYFARELDPRLPR